MTMKAEMGVRATAKHMVGEVVRIRRHENKEVEGRLAIITEVCLEEGWFPLTYLVDCGVVGYPFHAIYALPRYIDPVSDEEAATFIACRAMGLK